MIHIRHFSSSLAVRDNGDSRTLVGPLLPWGVPARVVDQGRLVTEAFQCGALAGTAPARIPLTATHPRDNQTLPIGVAIELEERADAAWLSGAATAARTAATSCASAAAASPGERCQPSRADPPGRPWRRVRGRVLAASDICHLCGHPGAGAVDHVISRKLRPDLALDPANLRPVHGSLSRCPWCERACNEAKGDRAGLPPRQQPRQSRRW